MVALPLAFFSLSSGKLPTYIMPCLLPLALLMGHTVVKWLEQRKTRAIRLNGVINTALATVALIALIYLQATKKSTKTPRCSACRWCLSC